MKHAVICTALSLTALLGIANAQAADAFDDYARVLRVTPRVEQVNEPDEVCRDDYEYRDHYVPSRSGAVIGGITGALIGSQVGRGEGRAATAAVGAIAGTIVGHNIDQGRGRYVEDDRVVRRCEQRDNWVRRTNGYVVEYEYRGHHGSTITDEDPGDRLPVRISITPAN